MKTEVEGLLIFLIFIMFFCVFTVRLTNESPNTDRRDFELVKANTDKNQITSNLAPSEMKASSFKRLNNTDKKEKLIIHRISYGSLEEIQD